MKKQFQALSMVAPAGHKIALGEKRLEIRSWKPSQLPIKDLLIIENHHYLTQDGQEDSGVAVALVDIDSVHPWLEHELDIAAASYWQEGYWAWEISHVRPMKQKIETVAKRKIYLIEIDHI